MQSSKRRPRRRRPARLAADAARPIGDPTRRLQTALGNRAMRGMVSETAHRESEADAVARAVGGPHARAPEASSAVGRRFDASLEDVPVERSPHICRVLEAAGSDAATDGQSIYINDRSVHGATQRRSVMAHELTHVAQERGGRRAAPAGAAQLKAKRGANGFMFGELDFPQSKFQKMVKSKGLLFESVDRQHISFEKNNLGFDPKHSQPEDPFRFRLLKNVVNNGMARVRSVSSSHPIDHLVGTRRLQMPLSIMQGHGIFLPPKNAKSKGQTPVLRSVENDFAHIYIESGHEKSLAHEFLGHFDLFLRGVAFEHPPSQHMNRPSARARGLLGKKDGIKTSTTEVFAGTVNTYLRGFVDNHGAGSGSFQLSPRHVSAAIITFRDMTKATKTSQLNQAWDVLDRAYVSLADVQHSGRKKDDHTTYGRAIALYLSAPINRGLKKELKAFLTARAKKKKHNRLATLIVALF